MKDIELERLLSENAVHFQCARSTALFYQVEGRSTSCLASVTEWRLLEGIHTKRSTALKKYIELECFVKWRSGAPDYGDFQMRDFRSGAPD